MVVPRPGGLETVSRVPAGILIGAAAVMLGKPTNGPVAVSGQPL
jgi:hypothetical protein